MAKTYYNNIVIGNSRILACLSDKGELVRLYWPNIGFGQHVGKFFTGLAGVLPGMTLWPGGEGWECRQEYVKDTCMAKTAMSSQDAGIEVVQTDYVVPEEDVLVRRLTVKENDVENQDMKNVERCKNIKLMVYGMFPGSSENPGNTLFDFETDSMIFYRHGRYIAVSSDRQITGFQIGNGAYDAASSGALAGMDNIGMMDEGAFLTEPVMPVETGWTTLRVYICVSDTLKGARKLIRKLKDMDESTVFESTRKYWIERLGKTIPVSTGNKKLDSLYKRSALHFMVMSDQRSGGILASPEVDEEGTRCGRYAFCWGRDAAFITGAMDQCGLHEQVERFYDWTLKTQEDDGSWQQRYFIDGNLAPSWGLQVDEIGTIVWGMLQHYHDVKDVNFLARVWSGVEKAVGFLLAFIDEDTGVPRPSFDIWEERYGEHVYSTAAVYGGITAGAEIGRILGKSPELVKRWTERALCMKKALLTNFWNDENRCFIRSVKVKLNPWGEEHSTKRVRVIYNSKGYYKEVTPEDWTVDVSMLGVAMPFEVLAACDSRMALTASRIEEVLSCSDTGGILRYQWDGYMGGNPWIIATLWLALYHARAGAHDRALDYLYWAADKTIETGLLPEQVDKHTGMPCWVYGLTWSHAMYVLTLKELIGAGVLPDLKKEG